MLTNNFVLAAGIFAATQALAPGMTGTMMAPSAMNANFVNMTFGGPVHIGQTWPIMWTPGNGEMVHLGYGNMTWSMPIAVNQSAMAGRYDWMIHVPDGFVAGNYTLWVAQGSSSPWYSPIFPIMPATMVNATPISASAPHNTVTVTYWDLVCGCPMTSMTSMPMATGTAMPATSYTWWGDDCACNKTAMAPAPTMACGMTPCSNFTVPPPKMTSSMTPTMSMIPPATYTGGTSTTTMSIFNVVMVFLSSFFVFELLVSF